MHLSDWMRVDVLECCGLGDDRPRGRRRFEVIAFVVAHRFAVDNVVVPPPARILIATAEDSFVVQRCQRVLGLRLFAPDRLSLFRFRAHVSDLLISAASNTQADQNHI